MVQHQPDRSFPKLSGEPLPFGRHDSNLSRVGASYNPGAIQNSNDGLSAMLSPSLLFALLFSH
jgi:hypothetical protein